MNHAARGAAWIIVGLALCVSTQAADIFPKPARMIEFDTAEGTHVTLDVSPDGKTIVFDLLGDLYTLPIEGGTARRITSGMSMDWQPRFSPDGQEILFLSNREGFFNMHVARVDGSDVRQVTHHERTEEPWFTDPVWMPDGKSVLAAFGAGIWTTSDGDRGNRPYLAARPLLEFPLNGSEPTELVIKEYGVPIEAENVSFSRDGKLAYFLHKRLVGSVTPGDNQVYVLDRTTHRVYPLTMLLAGTFAPQVSPDGKWLLYASKKNAEMGYRIRNLETLEDHWLAFPIDGQLRAFDFGTEAPHGAFTADSQAYVVALDGKIVRVAIPSGKITPIPFKAHVALEAAPLMRHDYRVEDEPAEAQHLQTPRISPDGKRIVFTTMRRVWLQTLPHGKPKQLVPDLKVGQFAPVWSPDGQRIAFVAFDEMKPAEIYTVRTDGTDLKRVTPDSTACYYPSVEYTPDGQTLVYLRGSLQSILFNFMTGENRQEALELRRLAAEGGPSSLITRVSPPSLYYPQASGYRDASAADYQNIFMPRPFFTNEPDRVYFYDGDAGLISIGLDGSKRAEYGKVLGDFPVKNGGVESMPAVDIVLSSDGNQALAALGYHVYLIDRDLRQSHDGFRFNVRTMSSPGAINVPERAPGVRRLSTVGGFFPQWAADRTPYFSYASTLFRTRPDVQSHARPDETPIHVAYVRDKPEGTYVLTGARILTMDQRRVIEQGDIVVRNNRIVAVGPSGSPMIPAGAKTFDVRGKTIMPGLIDAHCHAMDEQATPVRLAQHWVLASYLAYGVTTCYDVWPAPGHFDELDRLEAGEILGPRLYLTPVVGFGDVINSLEDARNLVARATYYRSHYLKGYTFGDLYRHAMIAKAAQEVPIMMAIHASADGMNSGGTGLLTNIILGFSQMAHGFWDLQSSVPPALHDDLLQFTKQSGVSPEFEMRQIEKILPLIGIDPKRDPKFNRFYPPTWLDERFNHYGGSNLGGRDARVPHPDILPINSDSVVYGKLAAAGVIVASAEHGEVKGAGTHWSIWSMAAQVPNEVALEIGTVNGAKYMGLTDLGAIAPGMMADMIILDRNPLENIRNTWAIDRVIKNGRIYQGDSLAEVWPRQTAAPDYWWSHEEQPISRPGLPPATGLPEKLRAN